MGIVFSLLCLIAASAAISLFFGAFLSSRPIAIIGSFVISELLLLILIYGNIASSSDAPDVIGFPPVVAMFSAPFILVTSYGSVLLAKRLRGNDKSA